MSDLQCPATLVVAGPVALGAAVRQLDGVPVRGVYAGAAAAELADAYATEHAVPRLDMGGLDSGDTRETRDAFEQIADRHRGETVLVLVTTDDETPRWIRIDADGWSIGRS